MLRDRTIQQVAEDRIRDIIRDCELGCTRGYLMFMYGATNDEVNHIIRKFNVNPGPEPKFDPDIVGEYADLTMYDMVYDLRIPPRTAKSWMQSYNREPEIAKLREKYGVDDWDNKEWLESVIGDGITLSTISLMVGVPTRTVQYKVRKYGITGCAAIEKIGDDELMRRMSKDEFYDTYIVRGRSVTDFIADVGIDHKYVGRLAKIYYNCDLDGIKQMQVDYLQSKLPVDRLRLLCMSYGYNVDVVCKIYNTTRGVLYRYTKQSKLVAGAPKRADGTIKGRYYYVYGNVEAKKFIDKSDNKEAALEALISNGVCGSDCCLYTTNGGETILLESHDELAVLNWLMDAKEICDVWYHDCSIMLADCNVFVPSFSVGIKYAIYDVAMPGQLKAGADLLDDSHKIAELTEDDVELMGRGYSNIMAMTSDSIVVDRESINALVKISSDKWYCDGIGMAIYGSSSERAAVADIESLHNDPTATRYGDGFIINRFTRPEIGDIAINHFFNDLWRRMPENYASVDLINMQRKICDFVINKSESTRISLDVVANEYYGLAVDHMTVGFATAVLRMFGGAKIIFDPYCRIGARMLAAWANNLEFCGFEPNMDVFKRLIDMMDLIGVDFDIGRDDALVEDWPDCDLVFTSLHVLDVVRLKTNKTRIKQFGGYTDNLRSEFIIPFARNCRGRNIALYMPEGMNEIYSEYIKFDDIIDVRSQIPAKLCIARRCEVTV